MASNSAFAAGFNSSAFRTAILETMKMGAPETVAERPTFRWKTERTYTSQDDSGNPYDFTSTPVVETEHADVQVECAVEFIPRATQSGGTAIGDFDTPRAIISMLAPEHTQIIGATEVLLGGDTYIIDFTEPPVGLMDQTLYRLHCHAVSEV